MRTVVGLFETGKEARRVIDELAQLGFSPRSISIVTNLSAKSAIETGHADAGLHTMRLSDVGTVAAAGPLGSALERPGERAGLAGVLQRLGLTSDLAAHFVSGVERGETLESLTVDDADAERVAAVMKRYAAGTPRAQRAKTEAMTNIDGGARQIDGGARLGEARAMSAGAATGTVGQAVSSKLEPERIGEKYGEGHHFVEEERTIPVYREELRVGKREVERGAVRVTKRVVEKPHSEQVLLREEHVEVERRPADRLVPPNEPDFAERQIEMAEVAEEAIGAKQTRLVEEVVVHKHVAERTATVGDTLRSTQIDVSAFDASGYRSYFDQQKNRRSEVRGVHARLPVRRGPLATERVGSLGGRPGGRSQRLGGAAPRDLGQVQGFDLLRVVARWQRQPVGNPRTEESPCTSCGCSSSASSPVQSPSSSCRARTPAGSS